MPQQSSPLSSLGNGSSVSATAGSSSSTNILGSGSGAGRSVTIPEFQGHPTNVVSKRRNHSGPNQVTMEGWRPQPWFLMAKSCLLSSQRGVCWCTIVPSQAVLIPPSYWTLCWIRSWLTMSSKTKTSPTCYWCLTWRLCFLWTWRRRVFYCDDCWIVTANPTFIYCIYDAVFPTSKQNVMQVLCYFKSVTSKSWIALHRHNHKHPMRCNAQHYGRKTQK